MSTGPAPTTRPQRSAGPRTLLIPLAEAHRRIARAPIRPVRLQTVPVEDALGRVSARTIRARRPEPPQDSAAMDGYAVRFTRGRPTSGYRLRPGSVGPGGRRWRLAPGEGLAVATGAPLPSGADAVVRKEYAVVSGDRLVVRHTLARGVDVHRTGEDTRPGTVLLAAGERVRPYHLAALLAQGIREVPVRAPRTVVIAVGDEIRPTHAPTARPVIDSISPLVGALVAPTGPVAFRRTPDDRRKLAQALALAARMADLIVTIGGTSVGAKDVTKAAVRTVGQVLFDGVRVNVLKWGAVGTIGPVPVVMLPGQVVSAVVVWHEYGRPVLARLAGGSVEKPRQARLARDLTNPHPMDSVYLMRLTGRSAAPGRWGVRLYSELLRANAYAIVPRRSTRKAGSPVWVAPLEGAT